MARQGPDPGEGPSWDGPWFHAKIEFPPPASPHHGPLHQGPAYPIPYIISSRKNPTRAGFVFRASSFVRALSPR